MIEREEVDIDKVNRPIVQSINEIDDIVKPLIEVLQSDVEGIKETTLKMRELSRLSRSGEITRNVFCIIADQLGGKATFLLEEKSNLNERLELVRARAKLEWAMENRELDTYFESVDRSSERFSTNFARDQFKERAYSTVRRWEELVSRIDSALSSLKLEEEISFLEEYLTLTKERNRSDPEEAVGKVAELLRGRLNSILQKWAKIRRTKIEHLVNLKPEVSRINDQIKETEARFAVGEFNETTFEAKMSKQKVSLKNIQKEMSEIRNYVDEMDRKIFSCSEMLKHPK